MDPGKMFLAGIKSSLTNKTKTGSLLPPCRAASVPLVHTAALRKQGQAHGTEKDREMNSVR